MAKQFNPLTATCHQVLEAASKLKSKKEKVAFLQEHTSLHLRNVLRGAFDDSIQWDLPEGLPPLEVNEEKTRHMRRNTDMLKYFVIGGPGETMQMAKRQKLFIRMLEELPHEDVEVIVAMKDKELQKKYSGITRAVVKEAFPKLIRK